MLLHRKMVLGRFVCPMSFPVFPSSASRIRCRTYLYRHCVAHAPLMVFCTSMLSPDSRARVTHQLVLEQGIVPVFPCWTYRRVKLLENPMINQATRMPDESGEDYIPLASRDGKKRTLHGANGDGRILSATGGSRFSPRHPYLLEFARRVVLWSLAIS